MVSETDFCFQEGDKVAPAKARFRVPYTKNSLSFHSRVFGFGSGPSRLKYRLLQDLVYEEAMCEGSFGNGLLMQRKQYLKRTTLRTYSAKTVP